MVICLYVLNMLLMSHSHIQAAQTKLVHTYFGANQAVIETRDTLNSLYWRIFVTILANLKFLPR